MLTPGQFLNVKYAYVLSSWVTNAPKLLPTIQFHPGPSVLSNVWRMCSAMIPGFGVSRQRRVVKCTNRAVWFVVHLGRGTNISKAECYNFSHSKNCSSPTRLLSDQQLQLLIHVRVCARFTFGHCLIRKAVGYFGVDMPSPFWRWCGGQREYSWGRRVYRVW